MRLVLFVCNHNAGRSQMAQGFFERYGPDDVAAESMGCGDACPYVPTTVQAWDIPDPAGRPLAEVRGIRDLIADHVRELIDEHLAAIRSDRTAHELRLVRLLRGLAPEFEASRTPEKIRACADAVLSTFDEAPIRSFVMALAHRRASECLRRDVCDLVEGPAR